jgi:hypothetical protein
MERAVPQTEMDEEERLQQHSNSASGTFIDVDAEKQEKKGDKTLHSRTPTEVDTDPKKVVFTEGDLEVSRVEAEEEERKQRGRENKGFLIDRTPCSTFESVVESSKLVKEQEMVPDYLVQLYQSVGCFPI